MDNSGDKHITKAEGHSSAFVEAYSLLEAATHDWSKADSLKSGTRDRQMLSRREEDPLSL